jgi:anti-anti-sigma regulatory factor
MHHVTSFAVAGATSIEVDGCLDVVAAYDLRSHVDRALRRGSHFVGMDLTRVTSADAYGVHGLRECCDAAVAAGVVLALTGCSRPFRADLATVETTELGRPDRLPARRRRAAASRAS